MAELAIPLIALGSMYLISNQDKKKELLTNMTNNPNTLPNIPHIPSNYPVLQPVSEANVEKYPNPNQTTDKFFNPKNYIKNSEDEAKKLITPPQFISLSGQELGPENFKHNNMTPYFGAKIRGATADANLSESIMDNMQGSGSQMFRKKEVAPLFKPQDNVQWAYGAPNKSDFFQSRVNPSLRMSNVKPWEEQIVAPGLNQGFTSSGSGGFNSGMEARDKWLPRNVDELRVLTNPKVTYGLQGHEGPADSVIKNPGFIGKVEKYLPDTYYNNTPDRWFTTTGQEKAQTVRSEEILQDVARPGTSREYFGSTALATGGEAGYAPQNYHQSFKTELEQNTTTGPNCSVGNNHPATTADYGRDGYNFLPTNRSVNECKPEEIGYISGAIRAVVAPFLDVLRPTRKEDVIANARPYENANTTVSAGTVFNPADRTKTTNREMQEGKLDNNHLNIQNQKDGGYLVNKQQKIENNRQTTNISYMAPSGGAANQQGNVNYNAAYNQRNNANKTHINRPNQGGTQIFNQEENIKIDKRDHDRENNRMWVRGTGPTVAMMSAPSVESYGRFNGRQQYDDGKIGCERIQPDILTAFKQNPYTQSLHSWAGP
jgi:hypothetical protein